MERDIATSSVCARPCAASESNCVNPIHQPLTSHTPHHIVKVKVANMRSEPSTGSRIVAKLAYGDVLKTLKRSGAWVKLQREGGLRGWVARGLLWGW